MKGREVTRTLARLRNQANRAGKDHPFFNAFLFFGLGLLMGQLIDPRNGLSNSEAARAIALTHRVYERALERMMTRVG